MANDSTSRPITSRKTARDNGLRRYFTGVPCRRGHLADRATLTGDCIKCRDDRVRAWDDANKDRRYAIRQEWRVKNKDKERASQRAWTERNKDLVKAYGSAYYRANKERHGALTRRWKEEHPLEQVIYSQNTRARRLGILVGNGFMLRHYHQSLVDQAGCCAYCGEQSDALVIDHVLAVGRDGLHGPCNCLLACAQCNRTKDIDRIDVFLEYLAKKRPGLWTATPADVKHLLDAPWRREGS